MLNCQLLIDEEKKLPLDLINAKKLKLFLNPESEYKSKLSNYGSIKPNKNIPKIGIKEIFNSINKLYLSKTGGFYIDFIDLPKYYNIQAPNEIKIEKKNKENKENDINDLSDLSEFFIN